MNQKLDFITEQMKIQQEKNREFQDLKADLNIIAKDIFETASKSESSWGLST